MQSSNHPENSHAARSNCPGREAWLKGTQIEPLELAGNENLADFIDNVYARSGFNGRRLAEGAQLFSQMIKDDATICLTLAGAMTPIGMSGVLSSLIEAGFIDFIVSTGANVYHDLHRPFGFPMVQGHHEVDDNALCEDGVARIYDVFIGEDDTLVATDEAILNAVKRIDYTKPFSTATLHYELGKAVAEDAPHPEKSMVVTAANYEVPIYTSSPGDSSIGMNLVLPYLFDQPVALNPILDIIESTAIVRGAAKNGVVEVGGGSPKNFYLQTQPMLHQMLNDPSKGGHDYFLQLTTDAPHWGGLSGATPGEAKSWGKIKDANLNNVVVYSCASLTLPLIAQYALIRNRPKKHRRLMGKMLELTAQLKESAQETTIFRSDQTGAPGFSDVWDTSKG